MGTGSLLYAQGGREGDIAILEVQFSGKAPTFLNLGFLTRKIREAAVKYTNYRVMTEENVFAIIEDKKIDLSKCKEAECVVEYGRMLQADKLVSTTLTYSEDMYYLIVELYDIRTAAIERSVSKQCKGCGFNELVKVVTRVARELFTGEVEEAEEGGIARRVTYGDLRVESEPPGAMISIDGKEMADITPAYLTKVPAGKRKIVVEKGAFREEREVMVKMDSLTELRVVLKTKGKGNLWIESEPEGATIYIDDKDIGEAPKVVKDLEAGQHRVVLRKKGYDVEETTTVTSDRTKKVRLKMPENSRWYFDVKGVYIGENAQNLRPVVDMNWSSYLQVLLIDLKYRYFSVLYGGIGVGMVDAKTSGYDSEGVHENDFYFPIVDLGLIEARYPLWKRHIKSLGTEPIAINGGLGAVYIFDVNSYGIRGRAGLDIFWIFIEASYYNMSTISFPTATSPTGLPYKATLDPSGFFVDAGLRFNW